MLHVMVYALAISAALSLTGFCTEALSVMFGRSRRLFWAATMVLSILWPLGLMLSARPAAAPMPPPVAANSPMPGEQAATVAAEVPRDTATQATVAVPAKTNAQKKWNLPLPSDRTFLLAWAAASSLLLLYLASTDLLLHYRASRWRRETVLDRQVLVSETTGPALLGAWRPQIVVPRWFLDQPAATQSLILEHEQQHVAARDPLLLRLALLIIAAVPWNLPMWWQLRRLRQAIELDCDARVLRTGAEAGAYGEVLLTVTQRAGSVPAGAIAMGEPVSALERRIRHLTGSVCYSAPRALAVVMFWAVGIGVAFALHAPSLPPIPARMAVADAAPAMPPQFPQGSPPPAVEATPSAQPIPNQPVILAAAQIPPLPVGGSVQGVAPGDGVPATPRLRPPAAVPPAPPGYNDPRSRKRTTDALMTALAARPDLLAVISGYPVIGTEKHVTVFMTEDGKVDRFYFRNDPRPHNDNAYGDGVSTGLSGIVPEFLARQWEPLGLRPEQLGQMGFAFLQEGGHDVYVHYAWPRRPGEPLGGSMPNDGHAFRVSFTYADAAAVIEHHLPGALSNSSLRAGTPWLLLSPEGEVVNSGYAPTPSQPLVVIERANPGRRVDYFMGMSVAKRVGENPPDEVVFGWLAPDAPTENAN